MPLTKYGKINKSYNYHMPPYFNFNLKKKNKNDVTEH